MVLPIHLRILFQPLCAIGFLCLTGFKLLLQDWRGYLIAGFALVWVANIYMSLFAFLRQSIKKERIEIKDLEQHISKS